MERRAYQQNPFLDDSIFEPIQSRNSASQNPQQPQQAQVQQNQQQRPSNQQVPPQYTQPQQIQYLKSYVQVKNVTLSQDNNQYFINLSIDSEQPTRITLFCHAFEKVDPISLKTFTIYCKNERQPTQAIYPQGLDQVFNFPIHDIHQLVINEKNINIEQEFIRKIQILYLIIEYYINIYFKELQKAKNQLYAYGQITKQQGTYNFNLERQKLEIGDQAYKIEGIYGVENEDLKIDKLKENSECLICFDSTINSIIMPCRHMCICNICAQALKDSKQQNSKLCPICRQSISNFIWIKI